MRYFLMLVCSVLFASIAAAQANGVPNGNVPPTPAQLQQQLQQAAQGQGSMTVQDIMRMQRMMTPSRRSNGPQVPPGFGQQQQAQQAYAAQQRAQAAADAAKKAERREKIKQSIIARKQKEEAAEAARGK